MAEPTKSEPPKQEVSKSPEPKASEPKQATAKEQIAQSSAPVLTPVAVARVVSGPPRHRFNLVQNRASHRYAKQIMSYLKTLGRRYY